MQTSHVHVDSLMDAVVLQCADHFEAGAIADVREARIFVAAEISLQNAAVLCAIEHRAPRFQFAHAIGRFLGVQLGHAPLVYVLAAAHRVGEMDFPIVAIIDVGQRGRDAAFRHDRVRLAEQDICKPSRPKRRPRTLRWPREARAAGTDDKNIVLESFVIGHGLKSERVTRLQSGASWFNFVTFVTNHFLLRLE